MWVQMHRRTKAWSIFSPLSFLDGAEGLDSKNRYGRMRIETPFSFSKVVLLLFHMTTYTADYACMFNDLVCCISRKTEARSKAAAASEACMRVIMNGCGTIIPPYHIIPHNGKANKWMNKIPSWFKITVFTKNPYPCSGLLSRLVLFIYFDILYHIT